MDQEVGFKYCPYFQETFAAKSQAYPGLLAKFAAFKKTKEQDPTAPFGASDKPSPPNTTLPQYVPKIRHAHLTHDVSIFYTVSGKPATFYLYGVLSHDEAGTGNPPSPKIQKALGKKLANQTFKE